MNTLGRLRFHGREPPIFNQRNSTIMAKLNVGKIRELHSHIGSLLADHDAACAQETADKAKSAATDEGVNAPGETPKPTHDADPLGLNRLAHARNGRGFV